MTEPLYHLVRRADWERCCRDGRYAPTSLETEGFIHCSTRAQVVATADRYFRGASDLLLVVIEPSRLDARLEYEAARPPGGAEPPRSGHFPHLYGPLTLEAVLSVVELAGAPDGGFRWPTYLAP